MQTWINAQINATPQQDVWSNIAIDICLLWSMEVANTFASIGLPALALMTLPS